MTSPPLPPLIHFEQHVNERLATDAIPALPSHLLPEAAAWHPMLWVERPREQLQILCDDPASLQAWQRAFSGSEGTVRFPIHPLMVPAYAGDRIVESGSFAVSASYRTVFFRPPLEGPVARMVPAGQVMMIKLHLDQALPGLASDRRLNAERIRKCVRLSRELSAEFSAMTEPPLEILREQVGLLDGERGALVRIVPENGILPVFSLYSRDDTNRDADPLLIRHLRRLGLGPAETAEAFGELLAEPLLRGALQAFQRGYSLEMHAQNTLISLATDRLIDKVYFRDLEGVLFFPELRARCGHAPVLENFPLAGLVPEPPLPSRWFNRNIDHDLGRIFRVSLQVLQREGFFSSRQAGAAMRSCRSVYRRLLRETRLTELDGAGRWLPVSRTPYGSGWRRGDYYRTQFR